MERLKKMLSAFAYITTCVVVATAVYISIFWRGTRLDVRILWQILGTSFLCSAGLLMTDDSREYPAGRYLLNLILYYIYVNVVVLTAGFVFEWFYIDQIPMVAGMLVMIACVFAVVSLILYFRERRLADRMLQKLQERNEKKP